MKADWSSCRILAVRGMQMSAELTFQVRVCIIPIGWALQSRNVPFSYKTQQCHTRVRTLVQV